jgi:YfiH family protein
MRDTVLERRIGLSFEGLSRTSGLRHCFSTQARDGSGNVSMSGGRNIQDALAQREFLAQRLGTTAKKIVVGGQIHSDGYRWVDASHCGRGATTPETVLPNTDALLTQTPGVPLFTVVADCAAVLLYTGSPKPTLAIAHAGWKGLRDNILTKVVASMTKQGEAAPAQILAGISPCIGLYSFEVGEEVAQAAPSCRTVRLDGKWHVDLAGWANDQLRDAGLEQPHIEASGLDTYERTDLFFSHRREGETAGRMGLLAMLEEA